MGAARWLGLMTLCALSCSARARSDGEPVGTAAARLRAIPVLGARLDRGRALVPHAGGFSTDSQGPLTTIVPSTARGALRVGRDAVHYLDVVAEHDADVRGVIDANAMVYADTERDTDTFVVAEAERIEEIRLLRSPAAKTSARWTVKLGPALVSLRARDGMIEALDAKGRAWLRTERIFAVDAAGRGVHPRVRIAQADGAFTIEAQLDVQGLEYPIALDPGWGPTTAMSAARQFHAGAKLLDGRVLVFGGHVSGAATSHSSAEIYDPATNTWTSTAPLSVPLYDQVGVLLESGKVIALGGGGANTTYVSTSELWDPATGTWSPGPALPKLWGRGAAHAVPGNRVVILGGASAASSVTPYSNAHVLDVAAGTWQTSVNNEVTPAPSGTRFASSVLGSGVILMVGNTGAGANAANTFDPSTRVWAAANLPATVRAGHAQGVLPNGKVIAAGGQTNTSSWISTTELFDPTTGAWSLGPSMAMLRGDHRGVVLSTGKFVVATGDFTGTTAEFPQLDTEVYDPVANTWSNSGKLTMMRSATLMFPIGPGGALLVGGIVRSAIGTSTVTSTVELLADAIAPGGKCLSGGACASGFCADGVCCSEACTGKCQTCNGTGTVGTCVSLPAPPPGKGVCDPYVCGAVGCKTACSLDADCLSTHYCATATSTCLPRLDKGAACTVGSACKTGFCVDGACCDVACAGACEACAQNGSVGTCVQLPSALCGSDGGVDASVTDTGTSVTTDTGAVMVDTAIGPVDTGVDLGVAASGTKLPDQPKVAGEFIRCNKNAECTTGHCVDGVCCDTACQDKCYSCALITSPGKCTVAPIGVDLRNECGPALQCLGTCDGTGQCIGAGSGTMCSRNRCTTPISGVGPAYCPAPGGKCDIDTVVPFECSPFICEPAFGACRTTCATSVDCASGFVCDAASKSCISLPPGEDEGCTMGHGTSRAPGTMLALMALVATACVRKRRGAR